MLANRMRFKVSTNICSIQHSVLRILHYNGMLLSLVITAMLVHRKNMKGQQFCCRAARNVSLTFHVVGIRTLVSSSCANLLVCHVLV